MGLLLLIAVAAGAASALLAAGVAAGSAAAVPLFYLAPLPVMIAGVAFAPSAAFAAVAVASLGLLATFSGPFALAYLVGLGAPAFVLSYASLLARPDPAAREGLVWFPLSGMLLLAAGLATAAVALALFNMAGSYEDYLAAIDSAFAAMIGAHEVPGLGPGSVPAPGGDTAAMSRLVARMMPPVAGSITVIAYVGALYLAGRAALVSGRLARPWPNLHLLRMPALAGAAFAVALAASMLPSLLGLTAAAAAAALLIVYAMAGFALVHALTLGQSARPFLLGALWVSTLLLGWPLFGLAILGLADSFLDIRSRVRRGGGPPAANDR